jgi:hypothetical protein
MEPLSPTLQLTLNIWRAMRHGTPFPKRADFDPLSFRAVLGRLSLLQIHRNPLRFKYCVHGTESARTVGFDLTGRFFDEGRNKEWLVIGGRHLVQVADTGLPSLERHFNVLADDRHINAEALVLPLSSDGYVVDFLLSIVMPHATDLDWRSRPAHTEQLILHEEGWKVTILRREENYFA